MRGITQDRWRSCKARVFDTPFGWIYTFDMNSIIRAEVRIKEIEVTDEIITTHLTDGCTISVPLVWLWWLTEATLAQCANYEFIGDG